MSTFTKTAHTVFLTSYGVLRRDVGLLSKVSWATVTLDEAQNIKNSSSATAQAARKLKASQRMVMTGTPVENRLAELWSLFSFTNPGYLGSLENFRGTYATPIERHQDERSTQNLSKLVGPFLMRRRKDDPNVIQDLPSKNEMNVVCTLVKEQATLYKAAVESELADIESATGITRQGRVLKLLMALKQICNHPAQYLRDNGPLAKRSGKLTRLTEMLEEVLANNDKALIFTQFREMGELLVSHVSAQLGRDVLFLHGGTTKKGRDAMVKRFQEDPKSPLFVLSIKAGGTGLNLTAANHVFHFDRWWNPAVEDQATDRAYRIGQKQSVQVHKFLCAGTVEEKIDALLGKKRELASKIVGTGENWITELSNAELRELFSLSAETVRESDEDEETSTASEPAVKRKARKEKP